MRENDDLSYRNGPRTRSAIPKRGGPLPSTSDSTSRIVRSLVRGLSVMRSFDAERSHMTVAEVAHRTDLSRATVGRILRTLEAIGYVEADGRIFSLRPRILELGYTYLTSLRLPELALPHLKRLRADVHESCSIAVLDESEIVYVARVATRRIMTIDINVGTRLPTHLTSMGRVMLAGLGEKQRAAALDGLNLTPRTQYTITDKHQLADELAKIANQGWALVDQELEDGLRSIAVPLRDTSGTTVAAMNVSASTRRGTPDTIRDEVLPDLLRAARDVELDMASVLRHAE